MNEGRRERLRALMRTLEAAREQFYAIFMEICSGQDTDEISDDAVLFLSEAIDDIQKMIDEMQSFLDSSPE